MATTKSSTIKRYNGTDYDTINPITTGQNVYGSGTNASTPLVNNSDQIDAAYTKEVQVDTINARTSSSASTYGPGSSSQVLKSNGTYAYWGSDSSNNTECAIGANFKVKNQKAGYQVFITNNENKLVPMVSGASGTSSTGTSKTMNTESFNPFGLIAYTSSSSYRAADALCSGSTYISYSSFDLRYAFNCGSTLTTNAPVYIVAAMQSDGQTAKLTSPYYSQTLPSTADGKIYIYLGQAVSTTNITMQQVHPVFEYIDGGIKVLPYDSNVVKLSGNQTIAGTKTFTSRPKSAEVYTKLQYISSPAGSGFPYIRTGVLRGINYTNKLTCVLDGYFSESQTYGFCGYDSGGQLGQKSGKWSTENDGLGTTNVNCLGSSNRAIVTQVLDFSNSTNKLYIGDTMIAGRSINNTSYSQTNDYPLFVAYSGTYTYNPAKLVLYSFKMYDGDTSGTLIRDFIPVRTANDEVGLLDLVENKFYRNQGTTAFTAGSDVETITVAGDLLVSSDVSLVGLTNDYNDLDNKPTIPTTYVSSVNGSSGAITGIATTSDLSSYVPTSRTVNSKALSSNITLSASDVSAVEKTTYEYNKEISFGSSGYLKIGSFPMYDSNITIDIDSTTSTTYHATVVIATQNVSTSSIGSAHVVSVYGDASDTITSAIRVTWVSGSRNYNVFFVPAAWSKNLVHIRAMGLNSAPSDICVSQEGTAPTSTSGLEATNVLKSNFVPTGRTVNSKALSSNIVLNASDVGALDSTTNYVKTVSVSGNTLSFTTTGLPVTYTPSSGTQLYAHNISITETDLGLGEFYLATIYTNSATPFTMSTLWSYNQTKCIPLRIDNTNVLVLGYLVNTLNDGYFKAQGMDNIGGFAGFDLNSSVATLHDTITAL